MKDKELYEVLLGLKKPWEVEEVNRANALPFEEVQQIGKVPSGIALLAFDAAF